MWDLHTLSFDLFFIAIYRILRECSSLRRTFENVPVLFIKHLFVKGLQYQVLLLRMNTSK